MGEDEFQAHQITVNQRVKPEHPIIAFDDKLHFISMFDCEARLMLFHKTVGSKTNEIPAVRDSNYVRRIILSH